MPRDQELRRWSQASVATTDSMRARQPHILPGSSGGQSSWLGAAMKLAFEGDYHRVVLSRRERNVVLL